MKFLCAVIFLTITLFQNGESLHDKLNGFSVDLYKELVKKYEDNLVYSPYSLANLLALTSVGARGETATQIKSAMSLKMSNEKLEKEFKELGKLLRGSDKVTIETADKMYIAEGMAIEPEFVKTAHDVFDAGVENINFNKPKEATKTINSWVEKHTNNKIRNIIEENTLDDLTRLVLVNTLYFKGKWKHPFKLEATSKAKFHNSKTETVDVDMMKMSTSLEVNKDASLGVSILRLPYEDTDAELVIILPDEIDGLKKVENNLEKLWDNRTFTDNQVSVFLPKFKVESSLNLIPILKQMGVTDLFETADLKGITKESIVVTTLVQKTFIEVNEYGTEAASASAAVADIRAVLEEPSSVFRVDHPFMFALLYDGIEIISGKVEKL